MSHLMTDGRPCGRPDGHNGRHLSAEAARRRNLRQMARRRENPELRREADAKYEASWKGIKRAMRWQHRKQVERLGAMLGIPDLTAEQVMDLTAEQITEMILEWVM